MASPATAILKSLDAPPSSVFQRVVQLVDTNASELLDPSTIASQSYCKSLESLASLRLLQLFCQIAGGEHFWDTLGAPPISPRSFDSNKDEKSTLNSATASGDSHARETRSVKLGSDISQQVAWYFTDANLKPGAPGWKLERAIRDVMNMYNTMLPPKDRLRHVLAAKEDDQVFGGGQRFQASNRDSRKELKAVERLAFNVCVLQALTIRIFNPIPELEGTREIGYGEGDDESMPDIISLDYRTASLDDKLRATDDLLRRVGLTLEVWKIHPGAAGGFLVEVLENWSHMIAVNEQLPKAACGEQVSVWFGERVPDSSDLGYMAEMDSYIQARTQFTESIVSPLVRPPDS
jgi:hypothetical protein